jgi:hypothetical protein
LYKGTNNASVFPFFIAKRQTSLLLLDHNEKHNRWNKDVCQCVNEWPPLTIAIAVAVVVAVIATWEGEGEEHILSKHTQSPFRSNDWIQDEIETNPIMTIQIVWNGIFYYWKNQHTHSRMVRVCVCHKKERRHYQQHQPTELGTLIQCAKKWIGNRRNRDKYWTCKMRWQFKSMEMEMEIAITRIIEQWITFFRVMNKKA